MKTGRAILSGLLIWTLMFTLFGLLDVIPATRDSIWLQGLVACTMVIPIALLAATFYYKTGSKANGVTVALVMVTTALLLDAVITVPFFEMPYRGRGHSQFFTHPLLWIIVLEDVLVVYLYYKMRVKSLHYA
ncbi:MAG TPA: DUF5367 family protein [Cyclobacteriaceae bacterium]